MYCFDVIAASLHIAMYLINVFLKKWHLDLVSGARRRDNNRLPVSWKNEF